MTMKLNETTFKFFKRGIEAREMGIACAPMLDPEVMPMLKETDAPVVAALSEWLKGWHTRNLVV
jgi:hypothetical protein